LIVKEKYFNPENFKSKSSEFLTFAKSFYGNRNFDFVPQSSALLVLDMQDYFLSESSHAFIPSASAIIPLINSLIHEFNSANLPVIFTININTAENAGMMSKWWKDLITEGTPLSEISKDITIGKEIVITKCQYDAFYNTELAKILKEKAVKQLVITGVMTHLCCETTVRSAFVKGYEVFFPVNGTAAYNEKFHLASLANLSHGFAVPVIIEDLIKVFKK
jgi:bifunctional isochorismate lyase/aryl carrier protein